MLYSLLDGLVTIVAIITNFIVKTKLFPDHHGSGNSERRMFGVFIYVPHFQKFYEKQ